MSRQFRPGSEETSGPRGSIPRASPAGRFCGAISRPGSPLGSPPPGTRRCAGDLTERRQAARNTVPPARSKPPASLRLFTDMTILRVRLFGFRFTDVLRDIDGGSARRAHGPKRGRSRLPGTDSMQGDGELFGCLLDGDWGLGSRRGAMRRLGVLEHDTGLVN